MATDLNRPLNVVLPEMVARLEAAEAAAGAKTLAALSLAAPSVAENAASGSTISGILGKTAGSTLSLANDDGGRFAISGTNLIAGLTNIDYEAASTRTIVLRETLDGATNNPRDTSLAIGVVNVNEQPSLRALLLSSTSLTIGTAASGAITEAATGSSIGLSGQPAGFSINGPARTWSYDGSGPAGNSTITLTEMLGDSPNSPRSTQIGVTVAAASTPVVLAPNPSTFTPVTSSSTGRIATDTGSRTHVASMIVGSNTGTVLQVLNDTADQYGVFFNYGATIGAGAFQLRRRLIGNDYDYNAATNVNWPRTLVSGDKIALIVAGDPMLISVELNDTLVWGPNKVMGPGVNDVWDQAFPAGCTMAGARSNAGARPVTVGRIETGTILSGTSLYTSGELVFTASYVGNPDGFRARVVNVTDGTQIVGWANATLKSTTGAGNATASITPTIPGANAGTDVVLEVQHMKNGSPVANTVGRQQYYARPTFTPLAVGYNVTRSVASRNLLFRDIIKEGFYDGSKYNIPFADIRGSGYIAAPSGSTLTIDNPDGTWTMTRNSDGTRYDCTFTGDAGQRAIKFGSGGIPSFLKYYPNNADPDSVNAGILPAFTAADIGAGPRDLEIGGGANYQAPQGIFLTADNRAKVSDFNYVNGTPTLTPGQPAQGHPNADGVPFEKLVLIANQLYAANPNCRHFGHIIPYHVTDDYISAMYTYIRDNLNPNILWYDEFANERPWNYNKERPIFEGTKAGLNDGTAYPNLRWFPGLVPSGVGQGPAAQAGDIIMVSLYGSDGHGGIQPGGNTFWRAKAAVAAGTDIYAGSSSSWDRLDTMNAGGYAAGQKQLGKASVNAWTIGRDIFGATAWNARMRPTLCGQARSTSLDGLAPELNVTGFMDLVRCIGNSAYTYDNIDLSSTTVTADSMYAGYVGDLEGDHQVRVAKWTDAVLRAGKQGYWYEWGLHPNVFSNASNEYKSAWYTLQAQTRIRELDRLLARNMKRHATGAAYYYQPFFGNEWGLRRNGYGDTTSPRWLGHKEGLAS